MRSFHFEPDAEGCASSLAASCRTSYSRQQVHQGGLLGTSTDPWLTAGGAGTQATLHSGTIMTFGKEHLPLYAEPRSTKRQAR